VVLAWFSMLGWAHAPELFITSAEEDWCGVIDAALTGDTIMLQPGTYSGPCEVTNNLPDYPGERLHIQSFDTNEPAVLLPGEGGVALEIHGPEVTVSVLHIRGIEKGQAGIVVRSKNAELRFLDMEVRGGVGILLTGSAGAPWVHEDRIWGGQGTGIEVGCEVGDCPVTSFELNDNWVSSELGVRVHSGTSGTLRDNVVDQAQVGLWVEGATWVTGNLVWGEVAMRAFGDPMALDNNLLVGGQHGLWMGEALSAQTISIRHNSILSAGSAMTVDGEMTGVEMGSNAVEGGLPSEIGWLDLGGNIACEAPEDCWLAPATTALSPLPGGQLILAGTHFDDLSVDWCGQLRPEAPSAGALERASGATGFEPAFKSQLSCAKGSTSSGSGYTPQEGQPPEDETGPDTGTGGVPCRDCDLVSPGKADEASCGVMPASASPVATAWVWMWMWKGARKKTER
jgi:hypothetical protein